MSGRSPRALLLPMAVALWCLVSDGIGLAGSIPPPTSDDQLIEVVRTALQAHDLDTLEQLVTWDGASKMKRRLVLYEMRSGFGRPIRSITLEPFPAEGFASLSELGNFKPNMDVTRQVRVVFDEPDNAFGRAPTLFFLIGWQNQAYRIALVNQVGGAGDHK